jgi:hypothetical protein
MKMHPRSLLFCLAVLFFSGSIVPGAWCQAVRATLVGRVTDDSSAIVPGTKLTLTDTGTNETRELVASDTGEFVFPQLAPGQYTLIAEHPGFRKSVDTGIVLQVGQQARIDVVLKLGSVTEQVEVVAAAPLVSSENAAVGNVVDQKKVVELPLNGRGYLQLAFLQPNVFAPAQASTLGFRGGFNVAGSSEVSNQYILDGVDNNDETTNQPLHQPVLDAVQEFRVLTGTYSAEYGRQAGGQIIVTTKSGTNAFHGSAWEFHRNSPLDARNFFAPVKQPFHRNQYGASLGGPVRHDKTFFFVAWESQNRGNGVSSLSSVPPVAFRNGDFSSLPKPITDPFNGNAPFPGGKIDSSRRSKQGAGLLTLYPSPNLVSAQNNIVSSVPGHYDVDQFSVRLDHHFSVKDQIYGAYEFADSQEFYPLSNPLCSARPVAGWGCDELQRTQQSTIGWTHLFNERLVNEARVGYSRFGFYRFQEDRNRDVVNALGIGGLTDAGRTPFNNGAPQIAVTGYTNIGGPTNLPQGRHDNNYNYIENMTYIRGSHTIKWGADIRRFMLNSFFTSFGRGAFSFDGTFTGNAVADLLLGMPRQADRNLGEPFHNARTFASGYYIQDDWKITPRLTINLGLRYDLDLPATERVGKMASFDPSNNTLKDARGLRWHIDPSTGLLVSAPDSSIGPRLWHTDWTNFGPRAGIAWRPVGGTRTVIRAGFGTFYNHQILGNGITPLSRNSPYRLRQTAGPFQATDRPNLANAFSGNPSIVPPGIDTNFRTAYVNQWSFGIQHEMIHNLLLDVSYVGSEGHKLPASWNINQALLGSGSVASRRPYAGFGSITGGYISSIANSSFESLHLRLERRFSYGLSFTAAYIWSKSLDNSPGISTSSDGSSAFAQDARNLAAERGPTDFDVPQRFVLSYVYDLPFHVRSSRVANGIVSGWQLTGILTLQKGQPFTVYIGKDASNTGGGSDRPNVIGDWRVSNPGPGGFFNSCTLAADGLTRTTCQPGQSPAWQIAAAGKFGNAGRNILRGPSFRNFDLGLYRQFPVTEKVRLQFRSEFFNLPNHANFYLPNATVTSTAFSTIGQAADQPQAGAQRQIQFALKVVF